MARKATGSSARDRGMWSSIGEAVYEVYGRRYSFDIRSFENGAHFAWCKTVKKWAYLYPDRVWFENGDAILAKCIKFDLKNGHLPTL